MERGRIVYRDSRRSNRPPASPSSPQSRTFFARQIGLHFVESDTRPKDHPAYPLAHPMPLQHSRCEDACS